MRLGAPLYDFNDDPEKWVAAARAGGYSAVYTPFKASTPGDVIDAFVKAAADNNLLIAETGAWSNPIDPDSGKAAKAIASCKVQLALAERIGARCCVNIVGSRNPAKWDGPHRDNFSRECFNLIVDSVRQIVDDVKPTRTFYCLETMPWIFPSGPDEYVDLIRAIDRKSVAVHLDPVNIINCPRRAYDTASLIRECFEKLGPWIRSCHAKDILMHEKLTLHLDECVPGTGLLDYATYLACLARLDPDTPLMLEHMAREDYPVAAAHIRQVAQSQGLAFQ